jgi:hypothetical protein
MATNNSERPARAGKKNYREEKNIGVDSRDQRAAVAKEEEEMAKPAPGLRALRNIGRDGSLCMEDGNNEPIVKG